MAARMAEIGGGDVGHAASLAAPARDHKFVRRCAASALGARPNALASAASRWPQCTAAHDRSTTASVRPCAMPATDPRGRSAAIEVAHLVKVYKTTRAVDDVSFRIARGSITGLLGGNGAGKTTTIAMIMGLVLPTSGTRPGARRRDAASRAPRCCGRMNFESPYVDMPMRLTVRQNLTVFGRLYARARICASASTQLAADLDLSEFLDRAERQALGRAEDPRRAGQGADQPARAAAAGRADRLARSRHRRLGAAASGDLPQRRTAPPSCWPRTTCSRSSGCATASSS